MYNSNDIQNIIDRLNSDNELKEDFLRRIFKYYPYDENSVRDVLSDGSVERFDRYDSAVCDEFLTVWEKGVEAQCLLQERM